MLKTCIRLIRSERGVALPMAMLTLVTISGLIIAFSLMGASEPVIANNQLAVAQARAVAESAIDRAIWALDNPADLKGIPNPLVTAAAPYDGSMAIPVLTNGMQIGTFTVSVTNGASVNERNIVATGWAPIGASGTSAKQMIVATVAQIRFLDPPAGLMVRGEIDASGNAIVDSRLDPSCGPKAGSWSKGATTAGGSATIYGLDGNNVANQSGDMVQNLPDSAFDPYTYGPDELKALKALAKQQGTYYQGAVTFNAGHKIPNGIIYVDSTNGEVITSTSDPSQDASVAIHGGSEQDSSGIFSGFLIVQGSLNISGDFHMHGLVYVLNDLTYTGTGTGRIEGAVISQNVHDASTTSIDTNAGGNAAIYYSCNYAKTGGGYVPQGFTVKSGTYKEVSG